MAALRRLLSIAGHGVDPALLKVYRETGFTVFSADTLRQALAMIKKNQPQVIVAEFIYAPTYGSQLSNFESLFAAIQTHVPDVKFIALVHHQDQSHLTKVSERFPLYATFVQPVDIESMRNCLAGLPHR